MKAKYFENTFPFLNVPMEIPVSKFSILKIYRISSKLLDASKSKWGFTNPDSFYFIILQVQIESKQIFPMKTFLGLEC